MHLSKSTVLKILGWSIAFFGLLSANLIMVNHSMNICAVIWCDFCIIVACYVPNFLADVAEELEEDDDDDWTDGDYYAF